MKRMLSVMVGPTRERWRRAAAAAVPTKSGSISRSSDEERGQQQQQQQEQHKAAASKKYLHLSTSAKHRVKRLALHGDASHCEAAGTSHALLAGVGRMCC